jgi:hypothetical protein
MAGFAPDLASPLEILWSEALIGGGVADIEHGVQYMRHVFALFVLTALSVLSVGAAYACNHDILCPDNWVWSDGEGTCVEEPKGTM